MRSSIMNVINKLIFRSSLTDAGTESLRLVHYDPLMHRTLHRRIDDNSRSRYKIDRIRRSPATENGKTV